MQIVELDVGFRAFGHADGAFVDAGFQIGSLVYQAKAESGFVSENMEYKHE